MKIFEQCKQCRKRAFCHWGEYEYWQIAHDNWLGFWPVLRLMLCALSARPVPENAMLKHVTTLGWSG